MIEWNTERLIEADKRFVWHPFTNMAEWCASGHEPLVLVEAKGALLRGSRGREYIDGNASFWTNIHGHNNPHINAAIRRQLVRVVHTSFLGFTNPPAIELARAIVELFPKDTLSRVFFSDDGSTGIEVALRIADQYWRLRRSERDQLIAFESGYHGDTAGAASLTGRMFAIEHEAVIPDILVLGKGLSGGYLPLAITLVSEKIFSAFDGSVSGGRALAYGHSYTGNTLGCVAARASLEVFAQEGGDAAAENPPPEVRARRIGATFRGRRNPSVRLYCRNRAG